MFMNNSYTILIIYKKITIRGFLADIWYFSHSNDYFSPDLDPFAGAQALKPKPKLMFGCCYSELETEISSMNISLLFTG